MNLQELRCKICSSTKLVDLGQDPRPRIADEAADGQKVHVPDNHLFQCENGHDSVFDLAATEPSGAY